MSLSELFAKLLSLEGGSDEQNTFMGTSGCLQLRVSGVDLPR
jgi:hypothetical protein